MEVFDALLNRRSVRRFQSELPAREDLEKIAEAGLYAASGKGLQTVKIVIVTNPELIQKLREWNRVIGGWGRTWTPSTARPPCCWCSPTARRRTTSTTARSPWAT